MAITLQKSGNVIARFQSPIRVFHRSGMEVFHSTVIPDPAFVPAMGNSHPFPAVMAVVDLNSVEVFPHVNSRVTHGVFYTKNADALGMTLFDHGDFISSKHGRPNPLMAVPGNSNLFTNIGYWAWAEGQHNYHGEDSLFVHYQEVLSGPQNALVFGRDGISIKAVDVCNLGSNVSCALGGVKIIHDGRVLAMDETDPETHRSPILDAFGDIQHVLKKSPDFAEISMKRLCLEETGEAFDTAQCEWDRIQKFMPGWDNSRYTRRKIIPPEVLSALRGEVVSLDVSPFQVREIQEKALRGYKLVPEVQDFGECSYDGEKIFKIKTPRSTFNHVLALTTQDSSKLLIFETIDMPDKKGRGLIYEDTALLAIEFARALNIEVKDALVLCNGSETLLWTEDFQIASYDGLNRKVTSTLLFYGR